MPVEKNTAVIDEFCDALWLEDGLARNTLDSYRRDLAQLAAWLEKQHGKALAAAGHADLLGYLAYKVRGKRESDHDAAASFRA